NTKALEARLDEKRGNALPARVRIGLGKNNEAAGDTAVGHPSLGAIQAVAAVALYRVGLNSRSVGARLRLGQAKRTEDFTGGHTAQIFFLLRVAPKLQQRWLHGGLCHAHT